MKIKKKILLGSFLVLIYLGNNIFDFTNVEIENEELKGLKIIHISDFHNRKLFLNRKRILKKFKNYDADFIFITGDLIDSRKTNLSSSLDFILKLKNSSEAEIYYVPGNHESSSGIYSELESELNNLGINIGSDTPSKVKFNNRVFSIFGIEDPTFLSKDECLINELYINKIKNMNLNKENYNILLAHRPEYFKEYKKKGFDLIFSGHAHGGQIRIPFIGGVFAPGQGLFPKFSEGLKTEENSKIIISRGMANSIFPIRVFNNPEIIFVNFK